MSQKIVECVPNFSEGRDLKIVDAIVDAIAGEAGIWLLGRESDVDHNRSVVTFAGSPAAVQSAAFRGISKAVDLIDLRHQTGVHPRIGAADVVPFIPVEGVTLEECANIARATANEVWTRLRVPVYLYEAAALIPDRVNLENIRRGGLDFLRADIDSRPPDIGDATLHPTAGAAVIGARKFLLAFNIYLDTSDLSIAKAVAKRVRSSSGGLPKVKAMGVFIESRGLAQVSMNLTDYEETGLREVFDTVRAEAEHLGAHVKSSEIIGLLPAKALADTTPGYLLLENFSDDRVFENMLAKAQSIAGSL